MVQLAGFQRRFWYLATADSVANSPGSPSWNTFSATVCSTVKQQASQVGPVILFQPDRFGRSPLHYVTEHSLLELAFTMLQLSNDPLSEIVPAIDPSDRDSYPISPLALAVCSGNRAMVDVMLSSGRLNKFEVSDQSELLPSCVARTAVQAGNFEILESILEFGSDINEADDRGQLLLCTATRRMPNACRILLEHGAKVNLVEPSSGRTAFCLASIRGDTSLVQLFLGYGADPNIPDSRGWLPIEHAAYRGHFKILLPLASMDGYDASANMAGAGPISTAPIVQTDRTASSHIPWMYESDNALSETCVWIRLGNNDATKPTKGLRLSDAASARKSSSIADEVLYTICISVQDDPQTRREWTLPILESCVNKPWLFRADSIDDLKLLWQLFSYSTEEPTGRRLVGSGVALMGTLNKGSRQNRESVVRDTTIPLLEPETSAYMGSIAFSYFWSKPHPPPARLRKPHYWAFGNGIGGHRGSGKNKIDDKKLQIGENTAQSFSTAISHGASFLEFDVQLTKDLIPVVYHDFLISETGTDSTMHTLTYDQFKHISSMQSPRRPRESRSNSLETADHVHLEAFKERMNYTHFNKINGFKANTRGNFIHEQTCSLEEVFQRVPSSVPMNIELKYPMLFETEEVSKLLSIVLSDTFETFAYYTQQF
jgi:glycerophosphodiester phosphodiesterase